MLFRSKGGDPFVFGRGGEEAEALAEAGCRFEIVPGVSSAIAGPAYAGIPVTHRKHTSMFTIFTGHEDPTKPDPSLDYKALATSPGTKVMLMGIERLRSIPARLREEGMPAETPVALVRWASTGHQKTLVGTLGDIAGKAGAVSFEAPAVAVFGEVVNLRQPLNWFENLPLFGKRIVVTRTQSQAGELVGIIGRELRNDQTQTWINYAVPLNAAVPSRGAQGRVLTLAELVDKKEKYRPSGRPDRAERTGDWNVRTGWVLVPQVIDRTPPFIEEVEPNSPAARAGAKPDDLIVYLDGAPVPTISTLRDILDKYRPGDKVQVEVRRQDRLHTLVVELEPPPKPVTPR